MSRLAGCFQTLAQQGRKALIPYIVAGDPGLDVSLALMHKMVAGGADVLEVGVPFSDPMAEGPVIQLAHERALGNGTSLRDVIALVKQFRATDKDTPVLLMGYANPVVHMGYETFADAAADAGVDALLSVDIPPEEVAEVNAQLHRVGMDNIFLVAPTTPDDRISRITSEASGFIYCVALKGVTGAGNLDPADVEDNLNRIRRHTSLPVAVGFGIKDAASARSIAALADGVVVGSALVAELAQAIESGADHDAAMAAVMELLISIRAGIDSTYSKAS